jgi:hypothetical protein
LYFHPWERPVFRVQQGESERSRLALLFFMIAHAQGLWCINFSSVLKAYGYDHLIQWCGPAGVSHAVAAILSPLAVGAMADQRFSSERVLRWLCLGSMLSLGAMFWGIEQRASTALVVCLAAMASLWSAPIFGLCTSLLLMRLKDAKREFGPMRSTATVGWMVAGLTVSFVLQSDQSVMCGYAAALNFGLCMALTYTLRSIPAPALGSQTAGWKSKLGLEAWSLLKNRDHRVVFIAAALLNAPLVAYNAHTHLHLEDLKMGNSTAFMSLGQVMEVLGLFGLAWLVAHVRLKWLFFTGIAMALGRYLLFSTNTVAGLGGGIFLHGICFTLFYMTAQIYLDERVPGHMRSRAQALLSLMMSGVGNLLGARACDWWLHRCKAGEVIDWPQYWAGLSVVIAVILVWFGMSYRGIEKSSHN